MVHPSGKFLYGSNRGHDTVAVFKITDAAKGRLERIAVTPCGGKTPRNINLTPDGKWLLAAHQDSDSITVFSISQVDGTLKPVSTTTGVGKPVCLVFLPAR